jgi:cysteine desulfurase/selenocysteine lyase
MLGTFPGTAAAVQLWCAMTTLDPYALRRDFPVLQREMNGKPLVYLDSAATSQKPRVMIERIRRIYEHEYARVEEGHKMSRDATKAFEKTRAKVAKLINAAEPREIVFCRGATEAIGLVSRMIEHRGLGPGDEILITEGEHHSNIGPWLLAAQQSGAAVRVVPVLQTGDVDLLALDMMLTERVKILSAGHVSNVTGCISPVKRMTEMAKARGILVMIDGAQAVAHLPVDVRDIGCDFYCGSGHKMGGPSSVGFLYGRAEVLEAMPVGDAGSTMSEDMTFAEIVPKPIPHKYEAGEPAFGEVEAWGPAIDYWTEIGLEEIAAYEKALTEYAREQLAPIPGLRIIGEPAERIAMVTFVIDGHSPDAIDKHLDKDGIAARAGDLAAAPLLRKLGTDKAVRASFLFYNTREEVDVLAESLKRLAGSREPGLSSGDWTG